LAVPNHESNIEGGRILNNVGALSGNFSRKTERIYRLISQTYRLINGSFLIGFNLPTLGNQLQQQ